MMAFIHRASSYITQNSIILAERRTNFFSKNEKTLIDVLIVHALPRVVYMGYA